MLTRLKQKKTKAIHREAIALVVFCQYSKVNFDINFAIYEYIKFNKERQEEGLHKMELFYRIDETPNHQTLIDYALGKRDDYLINETIDVSNDTEEMIKWYDQYNKLKEWDSIYLIVMKITELNLLQIPNIEKFDIFINWQYYEFRYSMIATAYSIILFSALRKKGMIKYKTNSTPEEKRNQIENMTWDFYFMTNFYRRLNDKNGEELLIATDDKVIKSLFKKLIDVNNSGKIETLSKYLSNQDCKMIEIYNKYLENNEERKFKNGSFSNDNHKSEMIKQLENNLY